MGRTLQKAMDQPQQVAMFMPLLEGLDGVEKMSKSLGNYIGVYESAEVMFKKVMEVPDALIIKYFELTTDEHPNRIETVRQELAQGKNPRDVKYALAEIITRLYHTELEVRQAKAYYDTAFSQKAIPDHIPELRIEMPKRLIDIIPLLVEKGFVSSNSEFRRLIQQGGIQLNQERLGVLETVLQAGDVLKIGKKRFVKLIR
jgi:tyrosyl-tRNA synthetase